MKAVYETWLRVAPDTGIVGGIILLILHLAIAARTGCAENFQRGGSAIVALAVLVIAGIEHRRDRRSNLTFWSDDAALPFRLRNPYVMAPVLAILGTLIWGYGDILAARSGIPLSGC
jgi:hypothetical protein